jgi:hypothetical protein
LTADARSAWILGGGHEEKRVLGSETIQVDNHVAGESVAELESLPKRLLTAFEVAEFVGCHEETVRRA